MGKTKSNNKTELKSRARKILMRLKKTYPDSECSLNYRSPYELMVAVILSAQCTDERVNKVVPGFFKRFKTVKAVAGAKLEDIEDEIRSTGFFRNKAKSLKGNATVLLAEHVGEVPRTLAELVKLPGVGRKTASAVLGAAFGLAEGVVVDTHVTRISRLLELSAEKTPEKIERDLIEILPKKDWIRWTHMIIDHGRAVCVARRPKCGECVLSDLCPSSEV